MSICQLFFDDFDSYFLDHVQELIWYQSIWRGEDQSLKKKIFDRFLHEIWAIAQKSNTAPEAKAYHSISQVKNLLIKLAWLTMLGVMKA